MRPPRPSIQKLAEDLVGFGDQDYRVGELSHEECLELDFLVFECQGCNWWFHQRENATKEGPEWFCEECAPEEE